jgi:hypothetical protein
MMIPGFAPWTPEPGRSDRELQIELEAAFFRSGADFLAFDTIVGSGRDSRAAPPADLARVLSTASRSWSTPAPSTLATPATSPALT